MAIRFSSPGMIFAWHSHQPYSETHNRLARKGLANPIEVRLNIAGTTRRPAAVVLIRRDEIEFAGHVGAGIAPQVCGTDKFAVAMDRARRASALIARANCLDLGFLPSTSLHKPHATIHGWLRSRRTISRSCSSPFCSRCVLHIVGGLRESFRTPGRHFLLHQDSVAVAEIENAAVLWPVHAREDAVQILHVAVIAVDPLRGFRKAQFRMAARHAFHTDQRNLLAIQVERRSANLELANSEMFDELVTARWIVEFDDCLI